MVYFADKYTSSFCFVSCYCAVVDDVYKQNGFHGNAPPSCKQRPLIKTALIKQSNLTPRCSRKVSAAGLPWLEHFRSSAYVVPNIPYKT